MMAIEDWIPDFDDDPYEPDCRYCGKPIAFRKDSHTRKWVPIDLNGEDHRCPKLYASARDFPKLEE